MSARAGERMDVSADLIIAVRVRLLVSPAAAILRARDRILKLRLSLLRAEMYGIENSRCSRLHRPHSPPILINLLKSGGALAGLRQSVCFGALASFSVCAALVTATTDKNALSYDIGAHRAALRISIFSSKCNGIVAV